jgi:hypothetical protein
MSNCNVIGVEGKHKERMECAIRVEKTLCNASSVGISIMKSQMASFVMNAVTLAL